jgi:hypothetical protein
MILQILFTKIAKMPAQADATQPEAEINHLYLSSHSGFMPSDCKKKPDQRRKGGTLALR